MLHKTLEPLMVATEEQFLSYAEEYDKVLQGTLFVIPFKNYQKCKRIKMAASSLIDDFEMEGGEGKAPDYPVNPFPADTFWEDYKYEFMKHSMNVLQTHLDEDEQRNLDL